jgi:activating signal cointegrator 1
MKAITVLQPWAHLLLIGAKRYEIRSWKTKHRGILLIHAGRRLTDTARNLCTVEPFRSTLAQAGIKRPSELPLGVLLGSLIVEDCLPTDQVMYGNPDVRDVAFGDFRPGHWAWRMSDPKPLATPIFYQGVLGIFDVPDHILLSPIPTHA